MGEVCNLLTGCIHPATKLRRVMKKKVLVSIPEPCQKTILRVNNSSDSIVCQPETPLPVIRYFFKTALPAFLRLLTRCVQEKVHTSIAIYQRMRPALLKKRVVVSATNCFSKNMMAENNTHTAVIPDSFDQQQVKICG